MIHALVYALAIGTPIAVNLRRGQEESPKEMMDPEIAKRLYDNYRDLIKTHFSQHGLSEWTGQMTSDPWSPGLHYITRKEQRKFIKLIPYSPDVAVAEIMSEPQFAEQDMDVPRLRYDGLEIRLIDPNVKPIIDAFCKKYKERFNQEPLLV